MKNNARYGSWHTRLALKAYSCARRALGDENLLSYAGPRGLYFAYKRFLADPFARLPRHLPEVYSRGSVIDVGANVGYTASVFRRFLRENSRLYAFEPAESHFRVLQRSMGSFQQVECIQAAVGDWRGEASLLLDPDHPGNHRIVRDYERQAASSQASLRTCPVVTLDGFLEERGIPFSEIGFLKIDVQGFEPAVIAGAQRLLRESPRLSVVLEYEPEAIAAMGYSSAALLDDLRGLGFSLNRLSPSGHVEPFGSVYEGMCCDILCLRESRPD